MKVTNDLVASGAKVIINISASPFHGGKLTERLSLISSTAAENKVTFIYVNLVGSFDGFEGEVVFDGRSIVVGPDGKLKALAAGFKEDLLVVELEVS